MARKGKETSKRVVITAHIDAKKGTPMAIDNATGVAFPFAVLVVAATEAARWGHVRLQIESFQELLDHQNVKMTTIYTQVLKHGGHYVKSPADMVWTGILSAIGILSGSDYIPLDF